MATEEFPALSLLGLCVLGACCAKPKEYLPNVEGVLLMTVSCIACVDGVFVDEEMLVTQEQGATAAVVCNILVCIGMARLGQYKKLHGMASICWKVPLEVWCDAFECQG